MPSFLPHVLITTFYTTDRGMMQEKLVTIYDEREGSTSSSEVCSLRLTNMVDKFKVPTYPILL